MGSRVFNAEYMGRLERSQVAATHLISSRGIVIRLISEKSNQVTRMAFDRSSTESLSFFLGAFNQVLLGYTLLVILLSVSMDGLINNDSDSGVLVDGDYNFEIKTAIERTKNHAAFMMGIVALTFAAVVFVTVDWALLKYKNLNKAVWEVHVYQ